MSDQPDGSTYWGLKCYNFLVIFYNPDGSTSWGYICYYILVKFDSLQRAAFIEVLNIKIFSLILTIQMLAQVGFTYVIIF